MPPSRPSIAPLLKLEQPVNVVDIGANPAEGEAPYKPLLDAGLAKVVGFEPNPEALSKLNAGKGPNETYLPYAVFDGTEQEIKFCQWPGMTSLLEPNTELLDYYYGFPEWGKVLERRRIATVRLDDVAEIEAIDYLKIDIQGAELEVFQNGVNRLGDCLAIHTEVEFLPMYKDQPLFSEVEQFLRKRGFVFHRFVEWHSRTVRPMIIDQNIYANLSQAFYGDAIFIKDFTKFDRLGPVALKKLALILHDVYGSYDIVLRALMAHDQKTGADLAKQYSRFLA